MKFVIEFGRSFLLISKLPCCARRLHNLSLTIILLLTAPAICHADFKGVGSGELLDNLKSLDGTWRSPCRKVRRFGQTAYQQDLYTFRLINLTIKSKLFTSSKCRRATQEFKAKFNYTLGHTFELESGEEVREFNLKEVSDPSNSWRLSPVNIVLQRPGTLVFGLEAINGQSTDRLSLLDYSNALKRRY